MNNRFGVVVVLVSLSALAQDNEKFPKLERKVLAEVQSLEREASELKKARNYERAIMRGEKCVKLAPSYYPCYRVLGSAYASIAARDQSIADQQRAKKNYEKYVELAPANDEYVLKIKEILGQAK